MHGLCRDREVAIAGVASGFQALLPSGAALGFDDCDLRHSVL